MKAVPEKSKAPEKSVSAIENNSGLGEVRIHENVISSLVRKVALQQEGVSRLAGSTLVDNIAEIVGSRRMQDRSIIVELADDNRVSLEIKINVKFGFKVPVVASKVQKAVIEEVEKITGMTVVAVNVTVQEIEEPAEEENQEEPKAPMF